MKSKKIVSLLLTGAMTAALLAVPAQAVEALQPKPCTISADHWSREDFSQEANPSVFTGAYSGELYNAIRQTMVDGTSDTATAYTMVAKGNDYSAVKNLMCFLENGENVVFLRPLGVSKTHLASALGLVAVRHRFSTYYINCHQLIE